MSVGWAWDGHGMGMGVGVGVGMGWAWDGHGMGMGVGMGHRHHSTFSPSPSYLLSLTFSSVLPPHPIPPLIPFSSRLPTHPISSAPLLIPPLIPSHPLSLPFSSPSLPILFADGQANLISLPSHPLCRWAG